MGMEAPRLPCPKIEPGQQWLLPEQEVYLRQFFRERLAALCSCIPINDQEAEEQLSYAYRVLGLDTPRVRWFDSPQAFLVAYALQWVSNAYGTEIGKHIHARMEALAEDVMWGIWKGASDTIWDQVEGSMPEGDAWDSMMNTIWMRVYEEIREKRLWEDDLWTDIWPKKWKE